MLSYFLLTVELSNGSCNISLQGDRVGLTCIYSLSFSLGLPANLLSLWSLYRLGVADRGVQLVLILNLLLSDLLQLLTLPLWLVTLQGAHVWHYEPVLCEVVGYLFYINLYASVAFLCLIALDRYLAIVHPLGSRRLRSTKYATISAMVIWALTILFCLSGLYPSIYHPDTHLCLERYPTTARYARFKIATVVLGYLLPCAVLGYTSARIHWTLQRSPSVSEHAQHRIVGTLSLITTIFILVFGPYHLVGGYKFVGFFLTHDRCGLERSLFLPYRFSYGLTSLNGLFDSFLYIFMCRDIQQELRKSLLCQEAESNDSIPLNQLIQSDNL
ncbi:hypothetical protein AAFF_G00247570 [Aldrovandia affinis]|uniref:G-protein coupled receptors family 1 profile domain-containing protein n=1 Tax=Aldrovandia affinis TaxID=143900 RepID=A0AAD7SU99_9TELE|nr:hypothetical protein AAFF_G00247570 [Aldrovandia affinis]